MATRALLAELALAFEAHSGTRVAIESVGGVDAAKRVRAGEVFDFVVLASGAIDSLMASGHLVAGSRVDLACSAVAVAVRAGALRPDIRSEAALRQAVMAAPSIGYSTGPSGEHLGRLLARWGIADAVKDRLLLAPPGRPVAQLIAHGEVEFGFQQLSELMQVDGVDLVGSLPEACAGITTFSAATFPASSPAVQELLAFWSSDQTQGAKRRHGMQAVLTADSRNKE